MAAKKKSCFSRLLKLFFVLLVVLIVLLVVLVALAIGKPVSYPAPKFEKRDTGVMASVITRLARSLVDKEGRVVDVAELHLTQNEVQTLLDALMRDDREDAPEVVPYAVIWEDGRIRAHLSIPIKSRSALFSGKALNLFIELTPYVDDGQLTIEPGAGSIGKLTMSQFALNKLARRMEREAMSREKIRTTLSAFKSIEPGEDDTLVLMFDPRDVNTVVRILKSAGQDPREALDDEDDEDGEDRDDDDRDDDTDNDDDTAADDEEDDAADASSDGEKEEISEKIEE
ncbi:MAG: hypothetical protein J6Y92_01100 [Lentisphaeria bacterium]|nr:hypothetical protein [Lentisphaeria bacterium]